MKKYFQSFQGWPEVRRFDALRNSSHYRLPSSLLVFFAATALASAQNPAQQPAAGVITITAPTLAPVPQPQSVAVSTQPAVTSTPSAGPSVTFGPQTPNYGPVGSRKAGILRTQPPEKFTFDRALLRDVLYFLADKSGADGESIPFVSIAENAPQALQLVTFRMNASPFSALESLLQQNDLKLAFENGVWVVKQVVSFDRYRDEREAAIRKKQDENELVGVMYQLRFDSADKIEFRNQGGELNNTGGFGVR